MIDILINGKLVDILNRNSINLRMNNVLYNPTEIKNVQAEYSFSFNLPTTPNNNKIFDYANELSKVNKFKNTYKCEVYQDGILIFNGSLVIQSIRKGFYNVNLVNIKINTLDDIFGDMKMNEIDWQFPFIGYETINGFNANKDIKIKFPLVSYGVFLKKPSSTEYEWNNYTSKFEIDKYNKWYLESFSPSPNLLELINKAFRLKGYELAGNIFDDDIIPELYMSTNLANDLIPTYNLGEPSLGDISIKTLFSNYKNMNTNAVSKALYLEHNLNYPYLKQGDNWNLESVNIYDLWSEQNSKITIPDDKYLFDKHSNCIVIPADGLYKISINANITLPTLTLTATEMYSDGRDYSPKTVTLNNSLKDDMPVEIQLVRNDNECELIHGIYLWAFRNGDRKDLFTHYTAYPHEKLYFAPCPSVNNFDRNTRLDYNIPEMLNAPGLFRGYMPKDSSTEVLAYDPAVNGSFIAGLSTIGNGSPSFIKNGYSWNRSVSDKFDSRYVQTGYWATYGKGRQGNIDKWIKTEHGKVELKDSPVNSFTTNGQTATGKISGIIYLKRNDVIMLKALTRHWENNDNNVNYKFDCDVTVNLTAYSPKDINSIESLNRGWTSQTEFPRYLNISEFLNKDVKVSEFINNFIKEFNLSYINEGKTIYLNKLQFKINLPKYAINLDDRANEFEARRIEYPSSMQVKYKIDTDEWGFELTVPKDKINNTDWKNYGDYGSSEVIMNKQDKETKEEVQLSTSYTYYDTFKMMDDRYEGVVAGEIKIPVISKYSYMIDGYSYEESMKHDGKGLPLRYWFKGKDSGFKVYINNHPINIYVPTNSYKGYTLSYKNNNGTLLTNYFNIYSDLSGNYVSVKCYLTADEYKLLKDGANVIFDSDVYVVSEIQGYDAMALNQTELLLIKNK